MISETFPADVGSDPSSTFPVLDEGDEIRRNPLDLHTILCQTTAYWQSQATASDVSLRFYSDAVPLTIIGDEDKIQQIIADLIRCCLKMTSPGDSILIKLLHTRIANRSCARIIIKDNGCGISPDALEHIFDPVKDRSNFICLASIEQFVILQDGGICIRSLKGVGTRFAIDFPLLFD